MLFQKSGPGPPRRIASSLGHSAKVVVGWILKPLIRHTVSIVGAM